jgi:RNA polymerase sigma factor for flagellar operon FliA
VSKGRVLLAGKALDRRNELVLSHMHLVREIAKRVKQRLPPCFDADDLEQAGMLGLIDAATKFDPRRKVAFGAYARLRIRGEMVESVRKRNWREAMNQPLAEYRDPDRFTASSGNSNMGGELRGGPRETKDPDSHLAIVASIESRERRELVDEALATLPPREAIVVEMYYRRDVEIREIATKPGFGVNKSRVSQIHHSALRRMKVHLERRGFKRAA